MKLRAYQKELISKAIETNKNSLIQADTGAGKTVIIANICKKSKNCLVIAHRNILVRQLSDTLDSFNVDHSFIVTEDVAKSINKTIKKSSKYVCSLDSLLSKFKNNNLNIDVNKEWLILIDEAHHVTKANKWGKIKEIFKNSKILGFTATPKRHDGVGLSKVSGGIFEQLIQADELKENSVKKLINEGVLSNFKIFSIPHPDCFDGIKISSTGDYVQRELIGRTKDNEIIFIGDCIDQYKKISNNKSAVVFCVSIDFAINVANEFNKNGVSAACVSSRQTDAKFKKTIDDFKQGKIKVLTHCDMISEGVDITSIETLIMLKKTASLSNYRQWVGRVLRKSKGKDVALIIDHVGNVLDHGFPDESINWSIDGEKSKTKKDMFVCDNCYFINNFGVFNCDNCGYQFDIKNIKKIQEKREEEIRQKIIQADLIEKQNIEIEEGERNRQIARDFILEQFKAGAPVFREEIINKGVMAGIEQHNITLGLFGYRQTREAYVNEDIFYSFHDSRRYKLWLMARNMQQEHEEIEKIKNHPEFLKKVSVYKELRKTYEFKKEREEDFIYMPEKRYIKNDIFGDERFMHCSPIARLLLIGLTSFVDDNGVHPLDIVVIKAKIFPSDSFSIHEMQRMIDELLINGLIDKYEVDEKEYIIINKFKQQQEIRGRLKKQPWPARPQHSINLRLDKYNRDRAEYIL